MDKSEFLRALSDLQKDFESSADNPGSFQSKDCNQCTSCMFCVKCNGCYKCTHSTNCQLCSHASHCIGCKSCRKCSYSIESENCSGSAYLVYCYNCIDCTYCFGCVGMSKQDFCILNEKYDRDEYFKQIKSLKTSLGIRG